MSEPKKANIDDSSLAVTLTVGQLKEIIHQERQKPPNGNEHHDKDHLLKVGAAAKVLSVSKDWLYDHADTLPFTRKLGDMLRFSSHGIQKWIATRKPS